MCGRMNMPSSSFSMLAFPLMLIAAAFLRKMAGPDLGDEGSGLCCTWGMMY